MDDAATRALIVEHFEAIGRDEVRAGSIYADGAVLEYVQSGERIVGKADIIASRQAYPGRPPSFQVDRVSGAGESWVAELVLRFGGVDPHRAVAVLEFGAGLIISERIYIAEPWEPPTYRAPWAEVSGPIE